MGPISIGLSRHVRQADQSWFECYVPDNEIALFGCSPGAYTMRSLGGFMPLFVWLAENSTRSKDMSVLIDGAVRCLSLWSCLALLGACTHLPDVRPFVQSTAEVRSAVITAGSVAVDELKSMPDGATYAEQLSAQWQSRVRAMDGLVDYADALQAIVAAGAQGASSVGALADSVGQLAAAAGIVFPPAGTIAVATDAAKFVYGQIALMRSARALEKALEQSQPAVEHIARTIAKDLADLSAIFQAANAGSLLALQKEHNRGLGFRQGLVDERNILYAKGVGAFTAQERTRLKEIHEFIISTNEWYGPYTKHRDDIERRLSAGQTLFQAAAETVVRWGLAYNHVVLAVQERRPVSTQSLAQAAVDLRDLIQRIRTL